MARAAVSVPKLSPFLNILINIIGPIVRALTPTLRDLLSDMLIDFYERAEKTENPYDDLVAETLLRLLAIPVPDTSK
jgi:hypothetical protein